MNTPLSVDTGPSQGIVLYDGGCGFCSQWVHSWAPVLQRHHFAIASLDEPWVAGKLQVPYEQLLSDIRLLTPEDRLISGADVYLYIARRIWWARPLAVIFSLPGLHGLIQVGYRWFARNRHSISRACKLEPR